MPGLTPAPSRLRCPGFGSEVAVWAVWLQRIAHRAFDAALCVRSVGAQWEAWPGPSRGGGHEVVRVVLEVPSSTSSTSSASGSSTTRGTSSTSGTIVVAAALVVLMALAVLPALVLLVLLVALVVPVVYMGHLEIQGTLQKVRAFLVSIRFRRLP